LLDLIVIDSKNINSFKNLIKKNDQDFKDFENIGWSLEQVNNHLEKKDNRSYGLFKNNDLIEYILENMSHEEKEKMPKDNNNNVLLLAIPYLERSSNMNYLDNNIRRDKVYKTIIKIKDKLKNIFQFENQYKNKISSNNYTCENSTI